MESRTFHQQRNKLDPPGCVVISWTSMTDCTSGSKLQSLSFHLLVSSVKLDRFPPTERELLLLQQPTRCLSDIKPNMKARSGQQWDCAWIKCICFQYSCCRVISFTWQLLFHLTATITFIHSFVLLISLTRSHGFYHCRLFWGERYQP